MNHLLFIYGTLQDPEIQQSVIGRLIEGIPDKLKDYKKSVLHADDTTYPIIVPGTGSIVEGRVIEISESELKSIDIYETEAYRRIKVKLQSGAEAWVYCE